MSEKAFKDKTWMDSLDIEGTSLGPDRLLESFSGTERKLWAWRLQLSGWGFASHARIPGFNSHHGKSVEKYLC